MKTHTTTAFTNDTMMISTEYQSTHPVQNRKFSKEIIFTLLVAFTSYLFGFAV